MQKKVFFIGLLILLIPQYAIDNSREEMKNIDIDTLKKEIKKNIKEKVYLTANRTVAQYKKPDFLVTVFRDIKKLCREIESMVMTITDYKIHLHVKTNRNQEFNYTKNIEKNTSTEVISTGTFHITFNKGEADRNCDELNKLLDFILWDYESNDFYFPKYGIPSFIKSQFNDLEIYENYQLLPKDFY